VVDIFKEVEEDIRKDRLTELWKRYGAYVIGSLVLIVLGTGGRVAWQDYRHNTRLAEATEYYAALGMLEKGASEAARGSLRELGDNASATAYGVLGRFRLAADYRKSGDDAAAITVYDYIANDNGVDRLLRDTASLMAIMATLDSGSTAALEERFTPLVQDDAPLRYSARELEAVYAIKTGDKERAGKLLAALKDDPDAPTGVRQRAGELLGMTGG